MQKDETSREPEPDPEATLRSRCTAVDLNEHSEDRVELVRRDAQAAVLHPHDGLAALRPEADLDMASAFGVLAGVLEHVAKNLRQPHRVAVDEQRRCRLPAPQLETRSL